MYTDHETLISFLNRRNASPDEIGRLFASVPFDRGDRNGNYIYDERKVAAHAKRFNNEVNIKDAYIYSGYISIHRWLQGIFQLASREMLLLNNIFKGAIVFATDATVVERFVTAGGHDAVLNGLSIDDEDHPLFPIRENSLVSLADSCVRARFLADQKQQIKDHRIIISAANEAIKAIADIYELLDPLALLFDLDSDINYTLTSKLSVLKLELAKQQSFASAIQESAERSKTEEAIEKKLAAVNDLYSAYDYYHNFYNTPAGKEKVAAARNEIKKNKEKNNFSLFTAPSAFNLLSLFFEEWPKSYESV